MNADTLDGIYATNSWSWDWLGRAIGVHPSIRPADVDGWLHQRGEMLMFDGKVAGSPPTPSVPQWNAVRDMGNLTIVLLHADAHHWQRHRPTRLRGYMVVPSRRYQAVCEAARRYVPLDPSLEDEDTIRTAINLVVGWCYWAAGALHGGAS